MNETIDNKVDNISYDYNTPQEEVNDAMYWMTKDMLERGPKTYQYFHRLVENCPTCQHYIRKEGTAYEDCMVQKWNNAYEKALVRNNEEKN